MSTTEALLHHVKWVECKIITEQEFGFTCGENLGKHHIFSKLLQFVQELLGYVTGLLIGYVYTRLDPFGTGTKLVRISLAFIRTWQIRSRSVLLSGTKPEASLT